MWNQDKFASKILKITHNLLIWLQFPIKSVHWKTAVAWKFVSCRIIIDVAATTAAAAAAIII